MATRQSDSDSRSETSRPLNVLFVDDDPLAVGALEAGLGSIDDILLQCIWGYPSEIAAACNRHSPDVVLVDSVLPPDGPDGIELAMTLQEANPDCVSIITTSSASHDDANRAWRSGIRGYLTRVRFVRNVEQLPKLLKIVVDGGVVYDVDPRVSSSLAQSISDLSSREIEVLRHKAEGLKHRDIADQLYVGVRTIDSHLANIRKKLGAASVHDALQIAREHGVLSR